MPEPVECQPGPSGQISLEKRSAHDVASGHIAAGSHYVISLLVQVQHPLDLVEVIGQIAHHDEDRSAIHLSEPGPERAHHAAADGVFHEMKSAVAFGDGTLD